MNPEDLKRKMRFSHPEDDVSMRNRNYRWTQPTYEIKNIRRDAEDPNNSTIYYEDMKGNKYKTNAQMFINRFSDFYIESSIKYAIELLAQVPGYDSPTPAVENENPASIPRSCPNCGYMAMGSEINSAIEQGEQELKCPRCGFSINIAPDEQFLMTECEMSKLKSAINRFSQWKENIMDLSDELYYPTVPEMEDPKMNRIRELEEELGLEPIELSDLGVSADEYLAYLEDEASGLINMAKKEAAFDLSFAPEFFGDVYQWTSPGKLPTNVADAIMYFWETDRERFKNMIKELFPDWDHPNINLDTLSEGLTMEIMDKIMETNTCGDLASPVDVWIDPEGFYTVDVYDEQTEEKETEEGVETEGTWFSLENEGR